MNEVTAFPIRGGDAWQGNSIDHVNCQLAQLICIGTYLQGDHELIRDIEPIAEAAGAPHPRSAGVTAQSLSARRLRTLALSPRMSPRLPDESYAYEVFELQRLARGNFTVDEVRHVATDLWFKTHNYHSARAAIGLLEESLDSESRDVRAMAAAVLSIVHEQPNPKAATILQECAELTFGYAREFASLALGLAPVDQPERSALESPADEHVGMDAARAIREPERFSVVVHGTFARLSRGPQCWYEPNAELPMLIRSECTPDLYAASNYFRWEAGYNQQARDSGTEDLLSWCRDRGVDHLDTVFAHSHGGNVALSAIEQGLQVELLVLLHTPVLPRSDAAWRTIQENVKRILDLRTHVDYVVHLDSLITGSRNKLPSIVRNARRLVPSVPAHIQVSHTRYVKASVWRSRNIPNDVRFAREMA